MSAKIVHLAESGLVVQSTWTQRNLERRTMQKFTRDHILTPGLQVVSDSFPVDITGEYVLIFISCGK